MKILAIDIGGTMLKIAETTPSGEILSTYEAPSEAKKGGPHLMERLINLIGEYEGYACIGISTSGQVNSEKGEIVYANENIPFYTGMKVKERLEREFGVPVAVENDVNAAALGEAMYGAGQTEKDFLCLTYGTGIGGAIIIEHKLYKGSKGVAGEFGYILTHPNSNPYEDGKYGYYEEYASTTALVKLARDIDSHYTNGRIIFEELHKGNERIKQVVDGWIEEMTIGLISLTHIFNPSCFILGGGILEQSYIIENINKHIQNRVIPSYRGVKFKRAALGNRAGILGATYLAAQLIK